MRQHQFALGLTICVFVIIFCIWGMLYGPDWGMLGLGLAACVFYPGAALLAMAVWPQPPGT